MGTDQHISFSLEVDTETHTCTHNAHNSFRHSEKIKSKLLQLL